MKKNLGKIFLLLLLELALSATQLATYKLSSNKTEAYVKEPIIVTFEVTQIDHTDNMFFLLTAHKSPDYEIKLLKKSNADTKDHYAKASFTYMLFALKAKDITIAFDFTIETLNNQALAQSYVDDHDGGKAITALSKKAPLQILNIHVKKVPKDIELFGDFTLKASSNKTQITSYDNANIIYTLEGIGYKNSKKNLFQKIQNVTLFSDIYDTQLKLTKKGYLSTRVYTYAMSATKSFSTPKLTLKAFSYTKHKPYTITVPSYAIKVTKTDPLSLLDKRESPKIQSSFDFETLQDFFVYILIFIAGFISAKFSNMSFVREKKSMKFKDIMESKTAKELILLLLNKYQQCDIKNFIKELELLEYKNSNKNFTELKHAILKACRNA